MYIDSELNYVLSNTYNEFYHFSVDGGWSPWYNMTDCSKSCGGGVITKWRNCTQPSPSCGGSDCQGENVTTILCNTQCCPGIHIYVSACNSFNENHNDLEVGSGVNLCKETSINIHDQMNKW